MGQVQMKKRMVLIDSNNIAYRAFYALPDSITTSSGVMTNAVLGFTNMLMRLIEDLNPELVICAFDSKGITFRHEMFEKYKMHRKKMPEGLYGQLPLIKEVMGSFNIRCIEKEGMEADDVLASIVRAASGEYDEIIIVTGDKDMLQMVSGRIKVLSSKKSITETVTYDKEGVVEKMGVSPERVRDLLALMGDSSDNIPGVPGIGPKTAVKLIKEFGSLEDIYKNIGIIKNNKVQNILLENKDAAFISKELTTLKDDLELDPEIFKNSFKKIDYENVKSIFEQLEFKKLVERLPRYKDIIDFRIRDNINNGIKATKIKPVLITSDSDIRMIIKKNDNKLYISTILMDHEAGGIVLYCGGSFAYIVDDRLSSNKKIIESLKEVIQDSDIKKSGMNLKQAMKFLRRYNMVMKGTINDFEVMYLLLNPVSASAGISDISKKILNIDIGNIESQQVGGSGETETLDKGSQMSFVFSEGSSREKQKDINQAVIKALSVFDMIENRLIDLIEKNGLMDVYRKLEEPLIGILAEIEYRGVSIDKKYLEKLIKEYDIEINRLTGEIYKLCGERFNINSSQQLSKILYEKLQLPVLKKTKTGLSTDAGTLKAIEDKSPVIGKILEYREKNKLKNTYIDVLPELIDNDDGRIHTSYNQMGTSTGRISSSEPNLQNIPVRTEYGKQIRKAFIPGKGYDLLMTADYSQIELRILAHLSGDKNLIASFNRDEDIHNRTASELFEVDYKNVPGELRRKAKAINFGIIYGMTEFGLASRLSISGEEAAEYIKRYFDRYPEVGKFLKGLIQSASSKGYSTTIFGRKRYIRELGSSNGRLRSLGERLAVNTPIQGSAADIMKLSTINLYNNLRLNNIDSNIILHVHDELVLELKETDCKKVEEIVRESMENCIELKVKLKVDIRTGKNWYI
jgi:DNA polymerase I